MFRNNNTLKVAGSEAHFYVNNEVKATFFVDATDNRITLKSIDDTLKLDEVRDLTRELELQLGAKRILIIPSKHVQGLFASCGYSADTAASPATDRFRETTTADLAKITVEPQEEKWDWVKGDDLKKSRRTDVESLMDTSKFLASKIKDYQMQGYEGFQLMCQYSTPFGMKDKDKLHAFCRVVDLGNGNGYLCDTWVDEAKFGSKQAGTAMLYRFVGESLPNMRLLLIAPPERVEEFDTLYGCKRSKDIMLKFGAPGHRLAKVFEEEVKNLKKVNEEEADLGQSFDVKHRI